MVQGTLKFLVIAALMAGGCCKHAMLMGGIQMKWDQHVMTAADQFHKTNGRWPQTVEEINPLLPEWSQLDRLQILDRTNEAWLVEYDIRPDPGECHLYTGKVYWLSHPAM